MRLALYGVRSGRDKKKRPEKRKRKCWSGPTKGISISHRSLRGQTKGKKRTDRCVYTKKTKSAPSWCLRNANRTTFVSKGPLSMSVNEKGKVVASVWLDMG